MLVRKVAGLILVISNAVVFASLPPVAPESPSGIHPKPLVYGRHEIVVTNNPLASKAAEKILKQGGNAVDAAAAAAFVLGLVEPSASGLGGGGFALTYNGAKKQLTAWDGREVAPQTASADLFLDEKGQPLPFADAMLGYRSVGVPSEVALLYKMQRQQGHLKWYKVVQPAIDLAMRGFPMSPRLHTLLTIDRDLLVRDPAIRAVYFTADRQIKPVNALITNQEYANTLIIIATSPRKFYTGKIARDIVARVNQDAGEKIFTIEDMEHYTPVEGQALCSDYRESKICSIPFGSGGVTLLELMKIYARTWSGKLYPDTGWMYSFLEAGKLAYADRNQYIADPRFVHLPLAGLLDKKYLDKRSKLVKDKPLATPVTAGIPKGADPKYAPDVDPKGHGTTSIGIVDRDGNAVVMTLTIEHQFGSHLFVDGFFLNNELTDFSFLAADQRGKPVANRVEPLKRPRSAISPAMVFDNQGRLIAISASPGGSQIICYVAKNLIQMLDFNRNPAESSASGNLCALNDTPEIEAGSDLVQYAAELKKKAGQVNYVELLSGVVNIKRGPDGGWYAAADPRREGVAAGD